MVTMLGTPPGVVASGFKVSGPFNPLSIPWHSAFWASDPGWTPPADGAGVSSWRNAGSTAAHATQSVPADQPTYSAAYANLNGKPAVVFPGLTGFLQTSAPIEDQPTHHFIVGWMDPTHGSYPTIVDASGGRQMIRNQGAAGLGLYAGGGAPVVAGAGRTGPFMFSVVYKGAATTVRTNGTSYAVPGDPGAQALQNFRIGDPTYQYKGALAFLGFAPTELTAAQVTDLETWAHNTYGVPIP